jgi:hypothetical protein
MGQNNESSRIPAVRGLCLVRLWLATTVSSVLPPRVWARTSDRRNVVVVTFGGAHETAPEGQGNLPRLLYELISHAAFFAQVVNQGILGYYVATASLATGSTSDSITLPMYRRKILPSSSTSARRNGARQPTHGSLLRATDLIASGKVPMGNSVDLARASCCRNGCWRGLTARQSLVDWNIY